MVVVTYDENDDEFNRYFAYFLCILESVPQQSVPPVRAVATPARDGARGGARAARRQDLPGSHRRRR